MAYEFYHSFIPTGSVAVLATLVALIVVALISGYKSVKVRPRRVSNSRVEYAEGEPRFVSLKAKAVKDEYKHVLKLNLHRELADSTIVMPSVNVDVVMSIMASIIFTYVFCKEHWFGMVQAFINVLSPTDGAAWGDIMASVAVFFIALAAGSCFYFIREWSQHRRAVKLFREYFFVHKKRVIIAERPHIVFVVIYLMWAIGELRKEHAAKKADKADKVQKPVIKKEDCKVIPISRAI